MVKKCFFLGNLKCEGKVICSKSLNNYFIVLFYFEIGLIDFFVFFNNFVSFFY